MRASPLYGKEGVIERRALCHSIDCFTNAPVDAHSIASTEIPFDGPGSVFLDDMEFEPGSPAPGSSDRDPQRVLSEVRTRRAAVNRASQKPKPVPPATSPPIRTPI